MIDSPDFECLTEAIYHEARGESFVGRLYVGFVIRNRVESKYFKNDYCEVIKAPWQFSYNHVLKDFHMKDKDAKRLAERTAYMILTIDKVPISKHVLYYHTTSITPTWDYSMIQEYKTVGNHIFYEDI
jgi:N-acetylmuramoyl-L-alanine amidase